MEALIMILKNEKENTYHPIIYFESLFSGGQESELNKKTIRYKSKGHRTNGFIERNEAVDSIEKELIEQLKEMGYHINRELEKDIIWDGIETPADVQIRNRFN